MSKLPCRHLTQSWVWRDVLEGLLRSSRSLIYGVAPRNTWIKLFHARRTYSRMKLDLRCRPGPCFFFPFFAVFMFLASTIQVRLKHKTKPYLDIKMIWSLSKLLTWREGFSFDLCLRPSQANLSSVTPGFNLLPVFRRSLIFLFGSWRGIRGSADPRCVSYRFKLVFYEFSQMRPQ